MEPVLDTVPAPAAAVRPPADLWMRRVLCLSDGAPTASEASARTVMERSLLISMARCLLTYIFLPFIAPVLGIATGATPAIGLVIGAVAIGFNIASIRRFWRADHRYRWHYTALASVVILMLVWLAVADLIDLLG